MNSTMQSKNIKTRDAVERAMRRAHLISLFVAPETWKGFHQLVFMDRSGDNRIMWDTNNRQEVAVAKAAFDDAIKRGFWAYKANPEGGRGDHITEFDPEAGKVIMAPRMAGG